LPFPAQGQLISKLSSSIEEKILKKMIIRMTEAGEDGLRLARLIEKGTYEGLQGYINLIKKSSEDIHSLKAVRAFMM
jgi:hypothetical protein